MPTAKRVLIVGASGFVGRHLANKLLEEGFDVAAGSRHPFDARHAPGGVTFRYVDLARRESVDRALEGMDAAVYLVHGMGGTRSYVEMERRYAETFRDAIDAAQLERVVYLGGMRPRGKVSKHLASRLRTGELLRSGKVPVVELQATMVVGGGSESFRIVRDLAARLPGMLLPKWLESESEPVAIDDIVAAIACALQMPLEGSVVLAAPGRERLSAREMIERTARVMGHKPFMIEVPLVTPHLSSYWIRLVTRANPEVARELVEGLRSNIVAEGPTIWQRMPTFVRTSFDEAVRRALAEETSKLPLTTRMVEGVIHHLQRTPADEPTAIPRTP